MVRLELSDNEAKILVNLLTMAGDEFSNHGCNDFLVARELGLDEETAKRVGQELTRAMVENGSADSEQLSNSGANLYDWQLYHHFAKKIRHELAK